MEQELEACVVKGRIFFWGGGRLMVYLRADGKDQWRGCY